MKLPNPEPEIVRVTPAAVVAHLWRWAKTTTFDHLRPTFSFSMRFVQTLAVLVLSAVTSVALEFPQYPRSEAVDRRSEESAKTRREWLTAVSGYVEGIEALIPNLKPTQEQWLDSEESRIAKIEESTIRSREMIKLWATIEGRTRHARSAFDGIKNWIRMIRKSKTLGEELFCWISLEFSLRSSQAKVDELFQALTREGTLSGVAFLAMVRGFDVRQAKEIGMKIDDLVLFRLLADIAHNSVVLGLAAIAIESPEDYKLPSIGISNSQLKRQ